MTGAGGALRAWSLPKGVAPPPGSRRIIPVGAAQVEHLPVDADWMRGLTASLRAARRALQERSADELAGVLGGVGARFLDPADPLRLRALETLPGTSGLSPAMASAVLDGMAADWTPERLRELVRADFPDPAVLDGFVARGDGAVMALGPALCVQVVSGSVPGVGAAALLRSLLVKAPTLVKPGRGDVVLPVLLAEAIRAEDPVLGEALAVVYWPGGDTAVEEAALKGADVVTAYGGDAAVAALRARTPVSTRFVPYHHRTSIGVVGRAGLAGGRRTQVASEVAGAVAFFDQRGCVSPQLLFVEEGGEVSPGDFATELAAAFRSLEEHLPGGTLDDAEASAVHQLRGTAELMAASGSGVEVHHGGAASWTVIYDPGSELGLACVGRVLRVRPVPAVEAVPGLVAPFSDHLQTVSVAGVGDGLGALARELAGVGVTRITGFDATPFPPPRWHHDGMGALGALVRWTDLEIRAPGRT
ncbi:MAG: hypothetical protein AMXMBFR53_30690 [Gemmatimonadota bacterium]